VVGWAHGLDVVGKIQIPNIVHFPCNYSTITMFITNSLHSGLIVMNYLPDVFRPQLSAIFRELTRLSTSAAYVGDILHIFIVVPCCMLFQSLLYCSNSCTSLHFKTLKSHTKTLQIRPYMFWSPLKPSSGDPWPNFPTLLNWNVYLHLL